MNQQHLNSSRTKTQMFCRLGALVVLLAHLPDSVTSFQSHSSLSSRLPATAVTPSRKSALKLSSLNQNERSNIVDVDSSEVIPCLDQWVTLPTGEIMGIVYHSSETMNDGDIIATSPVAVDDTHMLQRGMNVATISGAQYTLLNRATVEMAQHYNTLLGMDGSSQEDMPEPPIPTAATTASARNTQSLTSSVPSTTAETAESQDKAKELLQKVKDAGVSGAISYALWELAFWALSVPICLVAYKSVTGHWPDFQSSEDWKQLGGEAFVFVNLARFAVPIRIGLALSTVPWVQANLVDRFSNGENMPAIHQGGEQGISPDQMRAMEEYKRHLQARSPELRQQLEAQLEPSEMSAYDQYQQYRSSRSPELQQQLEQYQQPAMEGSSLAEMNAAMEEYEQYKQQRSPELREQYQQYQMPQVESSSGLSVAEEYEQYQSSRSVELQQQYEQYQQPPAPVESEMSAEEAYQQYQEQRSPELQQQYETYQSGQESEQESSPPEPLAPRPPEMPPQTVELAVNGLVNGAN